MLRKCSANQHATDHREFLSRLGGSWRGRHGHGNGLGLGLGSLGAGRREKGMTGAG